MIGIEINGGSGNIVNGEKIDSTNGKKVVIDSNGNKTVFNQDGSVASVSIKKVKIKASIYDKMINSGVDMSFAERIDD